MLFRKVHSAMVDMRFPAPRFLESDYAGDIRRKVENIHNTADSIGRLCDKIGGSIDRTSRIMDRIDQQLVSIKQSMIINAMAMGCLMGILMGAIGTFCAMSIFR